MPMFASAISLFCHFVRKLKQRFRRRIVGQPEVIVDLGVFRILGSEELRGDAGLGEHGGQTLRLGTGVGMVSDVEEQKRRNVLATGDVVDRGEIAVFCRVAAELLEMAEFWIGLAQGLSARPPSR